MVSDIWKDYGSFIFQGQGVQEECQHAPNFKDTIITQNHQNNSPSDTVLLPGRLDFSTDSITELNTSLFLFIIFIIIILASFLTVPYPEYAKQFDVFSTVHHSIELFH
jgi:hypothetical protein